MAESRPNCDVEDVQLPDQEMSYNINHDWDTIFQGADMSQFNSINDFFGDNDNAQIKQEDFFSAAISSRFTDLPPVQEYIITTEGIDVLPQQIPTSRVANQDWEGKYSFSISFAKEGKLTNSTDWTFSKIMNKLYVNMDTSCPIQFHAAKAPPKGSIIRALPAFQKPKHTSEVVQRCLLHRDPKDQSNLNKSEIIEHLVRCEDMQAKYHCEPITQHRSVTVPYYPPAEGMDYIYYVYKFMCFCSCMGGGISKRPLQIIFTLEHKGEVLGRKVLDIRICASPGRDRKSEEGKEPCSKKSLPSKRTLETDKGHCSKTNPGKKSKSSVEEEVPTKKSRKQGGDDVYTLQIRGKKNYKTLKYLNELMQFRDAAKNARDEDDSS